MKFLTKETHNALVFTTVTNVQCITFLLHRGFKFVLSRKFSSDSIESVFFFFFCTLQRSAGCNDMLDVRSALSGLEKTGIVAASHANNVQGSFVSTGNIIRSSEHVAKLFCSLSAALAA